MNYILRDIPVDLWRQIKSKAALQGITLKEYVLRLLRESLKS